MAHPTPARTLLARGDPVETLFQALVTATGTGVPLVLTIGPFILRETDRSVGLDGE